MITNSRKLDEKLKEMILQRAFILPWDQNRKEQTKKYFKKTWRRF